MERWRGMEVRDSPSLGAPFLAVDHTRKTGGLGDVGQTFSPDPAPKIPVADPFSASVAELLERVQTLEATVNQLVARVEQLERPWWEKLWQYIKGAYIGNEI